MSHTLPPQAFKGEKMMNINTKEKYARIKKSLIPKSITRKKMRRKLTETFKIRKPRKLVPFIPEKDKSNVFKPVRFKINPSLRGLAYALVHPRMEIISYRNHSTKIGMIKHAGDIRQIKKLQRRRKHLKSLQTRR